MHKKEKIAIAILAAALALVIGLIIVTGTQDVNKENVETIQPEVTAEVQTTQEADAAAETAEPEAGGEDAQEDVYEGAIAGLTEDEIAALALAEENTHAGEAVDTEDADRGSVD